MTTWESLLDAMDVGLESFPPVVLDGGTLPADPGPVPPSLVERAHRTLHRMAEATATLEHHRAEIGRELTALSVATTAAAANAAHSTPHFLDTKA
jgi:hypothetical protein